MDDDRRQVFDRRAWRTITFVASLVIAGGMGFWKFDGYLDEKIEASAFAEDVSRVEEDSKERDREIKDDMVRELDKIDAKLTLILRKLP